VDLAHRAQTRTKHECTSTARPDHRQCRSGDGCGISTAVRLRHALGHIEQGLFGVVERTAPVSRVGFLKTHLSEIVTKIVTHRQGGGCEYPRARLCLDLPSEAFRY